MNTITEENKTGVNNEGMAPNTPLKYLAASSIIGDKVHNEKDEHLGKIADIMLDITTGKIEYFVIEFGGFLTIGTKLFAIPFNMLKIDTAKKMYIFNQPVEKLENAPGFDMNHWPETNFHREQTYWHFM